MSQALPLRANVKALFATEGRPLTLTRTIPGAYNPATGITHPPTVLVIAGRGRIGTYKDRVIDGQNILTGDRLVSFQPDDWGQVPAEGDLVEAPAYGASASAAGLSVITVETYELGGTPISYALQSRR